MNVCEKSQRHAEGLRPLPEKTIRPIPQFSHGRPLGYKRGQLTICINSIVDNAARLSKQNAPSRPSSMIELWTAETADNVYELGTDTFVVRDGKIVAQSFTGKLRQRAEKTP